MYASPGRVGIATKVLALAPNFSKCKNQKFGTLSQRFESYSSALDYTAVSTTVLLAISFDSTDGIQCGIKQ